MKCNLLRVLATGILAATMAVGLFTLSAGTVYAKDTDSTITPSVYELSEDSAYEFTSAEATAGAQPAGTLSISGEKYTAGKTGDISDFEVKKDYLDQAVDYNLSLSYVYDDGLLTAADDSWHLDSDGSKKIDYISLGEKIGKGALVVQTSKDRDVWVTANAVTNIFETDSAGKADFYQTTDVQLVEGCYYRVIVAYELSKKVGSSKILAWNKGEYETKKCVEVYEFHAYDSSADKISISASSKKYNLGARVRTEKFDGYQGEAEMKKGDPHYGWDLGQFFVSGYTDTSLDADGNVIFLKNTGDQVSLWFNLQQTLDKLNNNSALKIEPDTAGYDQYFETPTTDFGYGALIIRKRNSENTKEKAQIYTDYLLASATPGADTKVQLFEEGDYEVALDYAIKHDKTVVLGASILPGESHYRIYFQFSVRNSNSMFFPRDIETTSELSNNAIAPNGFYLDLAGSKYLHLSYIREVLAPGATSITEDVRENKAAKDGDQFTKEGLYTITVTNESTGKETTKRIYVGNDEIVKAYMVTGLSISEIRDRIANGATIADDGSIIAPMTGETSSGETVTEEAATDNTVSTEGGNSTDIQEVVSEQDTAEANNKENINTTGEAESQEKQSSALPVAAVTIAIVGAAVLIGRKIRKKLMGRSNK
jgi:hypothetical protein